MGRPLDTVFFLSDYGTTDEFAGVVRAVLRARAPSATVVDLTHLVPPFDVAAGARVLERSLPHLGAGVVLAVVDPGVGSSRRAVALELAGSPGPRFAVGPDNGLLAGPADRHGGIARGVALARPGPGDPHTFDGRDVFAPAVAALCNGEELGSLGDPVDPATLVRLAEPVPEPGYLEDGRAVLWCEVSWIDRFGNAQLNVPAGLATTGVVLVRPAPAASPDEVPARRVASFSELEEGEVGLISDANGALALTVREGSAADRLGLATGDRVGILGA